MYPLPTLQFISTCINLYQSYIARCLQSQDRSPIPSHLHNPTHSFIHPLVTVFQVLRGKAGCVCDLKEFTLMRTRTHMASTKHTRTHTHTLVSIWVSFSSMALNPWFSKVSEIWKPEFPGNQIPTPSPMGPSLRNIWQICVLLTPHTWECWERKCGSFQNLAARGTSTSTQKNILQRQN